MFTLIRPVSVDSASRAVGRFAKFVVLMRWRFLPPRGEVGAYVASNKAAGTEEGWLNRNELKKAHKSPRLKPRRWLPAIGMKETVARFRSLRDEHRKKKSGSCFFKREQRFDFACFFVWWSINRSCSFLPNSSFVLCFIFYLYTVLKRRLCYVISNNESCSFSLNSLVLRFISFYVLVAYFHKSKSTPTRK